MNYENIKHLLKIFRIVPERYRNRRRFRLRFNLIAGVCYNGVNFKIKMPPHSVAAATIGFDKEIN